MILEALIARAQHGAPPVGYAIVNYDYEMTLSASGQLLSLVPASTKQLGPATNSRGSIVWPVVSDTATYVLGLADPEKDAKYSTDRESEYRKLVLSSRHVHPAIDAVARWVIGPKPALPPDMKPLSRILIHVAGHPDWWLAESVKVWHADRMRKRTAGVVGVGMEECSICGRFEVPTRLFPSSEKLKSSLISFQEAAWCGYGRKQGFNVPTCDDCARSAVTGFDLLAGYGSRNDWVQKDMHFLWWPREWSESSPAWPEIHMALGLKLGKDQPEPTPAEQEKALAALKTHPEGWLMITEKGQGRSPTRRFLAVEAGAVGARVERWKKMGLGPLFQVASALGKEDKVEDDVKVRYWTEKVALLLVGGEDLLPRDVRSLHQSLTRTKSFGNELDRSKLDQSSKARLGLLEFVSAEIPVQLECYMTETKPTTFDPSLLKPLDRCAYHLGRALHQAESAQRRKNNPQRTIRDAHEREMRSNFEKAFNLLWELSSRVDSRWLHEELSKAFDALSGARPPRFVPEATRTYFMRGLLDSAREAQAAWEDKQVREAAAQESAE